jgi:N-acyl-L-homoserine lactone synthetase
MLHIITPGEHHQYVDMIAQMFLHLNSQSAKNAYQKDEFDTHEAIYCVYIDDRFGLIGSARILPYPALLADHIQLEKDDHNYWECNRVFFDIDENYPIHEDLEAFLAVIQRFYQELYKGIEEFTKTHGIKTLVSVNPVEEHEDIVFFGKWPFEVESLVGIDCNGLVSTFGVGGCNFNQR